MPRPTTEHRIGLQFHPDRSVGDGCVLDAIARDGAYRSQFVTGTSNGGLTAFPGGDRWRWESRLFEGRYDTADPTARPVYGAVLRPGDTHGPAVRFGSAYLRLRPEVTARATFCFPDSVLEPEEVCGPDRLADLLALVDAGHLDDELDHYVEAHVHGGLLLERDVEAIVLDPSFRNTPVARAAARTGCDVEWHPGFRVATAGLDTAYRGPEAAALARSLGEELTPAVVGAAARTGRHDPQAVKRVWHLLARFGRC